MYYNFIGHARPIRSLDPVASAWKNNMRCWDNLTNLSQYQSTTIIRGCLRALFLAFSFSIFWLFDFSDYGRMYFEFGKECLGEMCIIYFARVVFGSSVLHSISFCKPKWEKWKMRSQASPSTSDFSFLNPKTKNSFSCNFNIGTSTQTRIIQKVKMKN